MSLVIEVCKHINEIDASKVVSKKGITESILGAFDEFGEIEESRKMEWVALVQHAAENYQRKKAKSRRAADAPERPYLVSVPMVDPDTGEITSGRLDLNHGTREDYQMTIDGHLKRAAEGRRNAIELYKIGTEQRGFQLHLPFKIK